MKRWLKREVPVAALVLAALAGVVAGREKPALELIREKAAPAAQAAAGLDLSGLQRGEGEPPQADPFARRSFAAAAPAPAAKPAGAPPLPFRYIGKVTENGVSEALLLRGQEHFSVRPGDRIDGSYRVEAVSERAIVFTYLPLNTRQTLEP